MFVVCPFKLWAICANQFDVNIMEHRTKLGGTVWEINAKNTVLITVILVK